MATATKTKPRGKKTAVRAKPLSRVRAKPKAAAPRAKKAVVRARPTATVKKAPVAKKPSTAAAKKGMIMVRVIALPGRAKTVALPADNATVDEAIRLYGSTRKVTNIRVGNRPAKGSQHLKEGDYVTMVGRVNGGL